MRDGKFFPLLRVEIIFPVGIHGVDNIVLCVEIVLHFFVQDVYKRQALYGSSTVRLFQCINFDLDFLMHRADNVCKSL